MKPKCDPTRRAFCLHATALALAGCAAKPSEDTASARPAVDTGASADDTADSGDTASTGSPADETSEPNTELFVPYAEHPQLQALGGFALVHNTSGSVEVAVMRLAEGVKALLGICTHEGCFTEFDPTAKLHLCPCHGGVFSAGGTVLAGPPQYDLYSPPTREVALGVFVDLGGWL